MIDLREMFTGICRLAALKDIQHSGHAWLGVHPRTLGEQDRGGIHSNSRSRDAAAANNKTKNN